MIGNKKFFIDTGIPEYTGTIECYELLSKYADGFFSDFSKQQVYSDSIYLIGVSEFWRNKDKIKKLYDVPGTTFVLCHINEGSETCIDHLVLMGLYDDAMNKKFTILSSGNGPTDPRLSYISIETFSLRTLVHQGNINKIVHIADIFNVKNKPYKFLFLNGTMRKHRKYLLEKFKTNKLLYQSLWSNLERRFVDGYGWMHNKVELIDKNGNDLMKKYFDYKLLPEEYDVETSSEIKNDPTYLDGETKLIKYDLFKGIWRDGELVVKQYTDTYFSLVTETVFNYEYSMFSEKIWKPIMIGHPFIVASNAGFYRDLHNEGFKTFGSLIDESFDNEPNGQKRLEKIARVVEDLCAQDLDSFIDSCKDICVHNQNRFLEYATSQIPKLPEKFIKFLSN